MKKVLKKALVLGLLLSLLIAKSPQISCVNSHAEWTDSGSVRG